MWWEPSPAGFEPATFGFGGQRSIQLGYGDSRPALESISGPRVVKAYNGRPLPTGTAGLAKIPALSCLDDHSLQGTEEPCMKAEPLLAKLNELRKEAEGNPEDMEWLTLHHAFCFISYHMGDFQAYLNEIAAPKE